MATDNNTSALLALPVELLGRVADALGPESLLMLRLTCKVLEHSTYDLFAKTFFERRYCCIYYEPRWLLLSKVISSRLGSRVREVTFTVELLESKWHKDLQLAPHDFREDMYAAQCVAGGELSLSISPQTQIPAWPSTANFHRVFRDIKRLAPRTPVKLEFLKAWAPGADLEDSLLKVDILIAAVTAELAIDTLKLDVEDAHLLSSVLIHLEPELMASIGPLKSFHFRKQGNGHEPQLVTAILKAANDLRELVATSIPGMPMTTAVLRAHDFSLLTTIRVSGAIFTGEGLITGLSACRSMLHLQLSDVALTNGEVAWPSVFRALTGLLNLHQLILSALWDRVGALSNRRLVFRGLSNGKTFLDGKKIEYRGGEQMAAGLGELTTTPLPREYDNRIYLIAFSRVGGCHICGCGTG